MIRPSITATYERPQTEPVELSWLTHAPALYRKRRNCSTNWCSSEPFTTLF
jgi:hypothetical protein